MESPENSAARPSVAERDVAQLELQVYLVRKGETLGTQYEQQLADLRQRVEAKETQEQNKIRELIAQVQQINDQLRGSQAQLDAFQLT
jgi:hypothetical protein